MRQEFNGIFFYQNATNGYWERARGTPRKMHVYVWEFYNKQKLPTGYCIHHIDHDKGNNTIENLQLMTLRDHALYHKDNLELAQVCSKEWHKSQAGLAWHTNHGKQIAANWPEREYTCEVCGKKFRMKSQRTDYRFCSNTCKATFRRISGVDNETRRCARCGREFEVNKYSRTVCCSAQCAAQLRWDKKRKACRS